jgi:hypothetical protein
MDGTYSMHGEVRNTYKVSVRKSGWKVQQGNLGIDGRIILERNRV